MNLKYHLLVAAAALSLGGCSTDDTSTEPEIGGGYKIAFTVAEDSETRTTLTAGDFMRWVPTDKVGIYTVGINENPNTLTVADVNQHPVEFIGILDKLVSNGDCFYAYYPYDAEQSTDPAAVKLTIPAAQTQAAAGEYNGQSHPLVAVPTTFTWEKDSYAARISSVRFRLLGAIVELQIYSSSTGERLRGENIKSVKFVSEEPMAGDFTFDLTGVTVKEELPISGYELKEVTTTLDEPADVPATKEEAALVYLTIAPGTYAGDFVVTTNAAQYTFHLAESMTFGRAVIKGLPADLAKATQKPLYAETDPIQFTDPAVKATCLANWDTNRDGELSYGEAAAVQSIGKKFQSASIGSFDELQYFTGLKEIESLAFLSCSSLTSVTIPEGVTSIENQAFQHCSKLTSVNIPNGVTTIGDWVFLNCSSLKSINIPKTVSDFGDKVFQGCSSLSAFYGDCASDDHRCLILNGKLLAFAKAGLTESEYAIPDGVTEIGKSVFKDCRSLTSITIPQSVSSIGTEAFVGCSSLEAFNGKFASEDRRCLILDGKLLAFAPAGRTEYTIPDQVTAIGSHAFDGCSSLTSITIPDKVTAIGECAFLGCRSLTSITIPDKVTAIGKLAFNECRNLTSVYCKPATPPTLTTGEIFDYYDTTLKIYVPADFVETYKAAEGWSTYADRIVADDSQPEHDENAPITFTDTAVKEICIAAGWDTNTDGELSYGEAAAVTDLGSVFKNKTSINSFNELQYFTGLKEIGGNAFYNCSSLTSINLPDELTTIGNTAFRNCSGLTSITIPEGVTSIGTSAFSGCSKLESINIPDGVTAIESSTFYGCSGLKNITIPNGVEKIGDYAFYNCSGLTSITIPNSVTSIGDYAFEYCSGLTSIDIPDGVTEIGKEAFYECSNLTSINIPAGVTKIEASTFRGCEKLTSITIPAGVTEIGSHAFMNCIKLANNITIPDNITTIQEYTFCGCWNLTSITIPDKVTLIGENAFRDCRGLTSITIPEGVKEIKDKAFYDCSVLKDVYCKPMEPPILGSNVFDETPTDMKIHVPAGSDGVYQAKWSSYDGQIVEDIN